MQKTKIGAIDWSKLSCRSGDATFVAEELKLLFDNPRDEARFDSLWPYLCSEGTTHSSAFASAPFLLELARLADGHAQFKYLYVLALFKMCEPDDSNHPRACPSDYREKYESSLRLSLIHISEPTRPY